MGVDAHISFRATGPIDDLLTDWPEGFGRIIEHKVKPLQDNWFEPGGGDPYMPEFDHTHVVDTLVRYWDGDEKDGSGLLIITALLALVRHPNVDKIWYGPDEFQDYRLTSDRLLDLVKAWMRSE